MYLSNTDTQCKCGLPQTKIALKVYKRSKVYFYGVYDTF